MNAAVNTLKRESALATAASKQISASKRRQAQVWSTQFASFVRRNSTLDPALGEILL